MPGRWCQDVGDRNVPYFSPIYVRAVTPKKSGRRELTLQFLNAEYAEGVQEFSLNLRILKHANEYIVSELIYSEEASVDRVAIVSRIEFEWMRRFCPARWNSSPPESFGSLEQNSITYYLNALFVPSL